MTNELNCDNLQYYEAARLIEKSRLAVFLPEQESQLHREYLISVEVMAFGLVKIQWRWLH